MAREESFDNFVSLHTLQKCRNIRIERNASEIMVPTRHRHGHTTCHGAGIGDSEYSQGHHIRELLKYFDWSSHVVDFSMVHQTKERKLRLSTIHSSFYYSHHRRRDHWPFVCQSTRITFLICSHFSKNSVNNTKKISTRPSYPDATAELGDLI